MNNSTSTDIRQSEGWGKYLEAIGWQTEVITHQKRTTRIYIRHLPVFGSLIKIPRTILPLPWAEIDKIAKKHRAILVKLEPVNSPLSIIHYPFTPDSWPLSPTKTIQIDLLKSEEELLANLSKDARYCLRKAKENGLSVQIADCRGQSIVIPDLIGDPEYCIDSRLRGNDKKTDPIEIFYNLWAKNAQDKGFWVPFKKEMMALWDAFKEDAHLIFITHDRSVKTVIPNQIGDPEYCLDSLFQGNDKEICKTCAVVAGALVLTHGKIAYYMHAFSTPEGRSLNAPYLLVWEAMLLAKKLKCQILDLEGIWDERFPKRNKKWQGFTHFKKGFGGREVEYPGSFTKYYSPFWKLFFKLGNIF